MNPYDHSNGNGAVLFVDPFATVCEVVALILRNEGYMVLTATSFAEALRIASNGEPLDLLLVDDELAPTEGQDLTGVFLEWHPDGVVLALSQPRHAEAMFTGKTLIESVADALQSRFVSSVAESRRYALSA